MTDLSKISRPTLRRSPPSSCSSLTRRRRPSSLRLGIDVAADITVWPTFGVEPGTILGLDLAALVSGFGPEPESKSSKETVIHMDDTTPLHIGSVGSPSTIAAPTISVKLIVSPRA